MTIFLKKIKQPYFRCNNLLFEKNPAILLKIVIFQDKIQIPLQYRIIIMAKKVSKIGKLPVFIQKLIRILDEPNFSELVVWLPQENGFHILNVIKFTEIVLPQYFKHQNMSSFVRQLHMYGFNRTRDSEQHVYFHPKFKKGHIYQMKKIHRKNIHQKKNTDRQDSFSQSNFDPSQEYVKQEQIEWMEKCEKLVEENQELKNINKELMNKIKQFQVFQKNMQKQMLQNKQKGFSNKDYKMQGSTSSQDKSETKAPLIKQQALQIIGSSFGFCHNFGGLQQKQSYNYLKNSDK